MLSSTQTQCPVHALEYSCSRAITVTKPEGIARCDATKVSQTVGRRCLGQSRFIVEESGQGTCFSCKSALDGNKIPPL